MNNGNINQNNNQEPQQPQYQQPQQPQYQPQPQYQQPQPQYQQPQYQPQYQQPMYQQSMYQKPPRNPMDGRAFSIAALAIGCCSVVLCWTPILNLILLACGILAIIFGVKGRKMSVMAYGKSSGLATAGFILGIVGTAIAGIGAVSCTACIIAGASCNACTSCMFGSLF